MRHSAIVVPGVIVAMAVHWTAVPAAVGAQPPAEPVPLASLRNGDTVRVSSVAPYHRRTIAVIRELDRDTLRLGALAGAGHLQRRDIIAVTALTRMEVQRGRTTRGERSVSAGLVGALGGGLVGGVICGLAKCGASAADDQYAGLDGFTRGLSIGGLAGAIAGGIVGGREHRRWQRVNLLR